MDPNPKSFPLLSYVLSRLNLASHSPSPLEPDIEQPLADPPPPAAIGIELSRMPADLLASMTRAIADVAETRAVLQTLGDRPDHESVDAARARLNLIDSDLAHKLEEIVLSPRPDGVDRIQWRATLSEREKECRDEAEREKNESRSIIQMDEMHEGYERMLREAEVRLERMYGSAAEGGGGDESEPPAVAEGEEDQINEEVIGILQEASGRYMERVELADRQLKFLPEAFGRMRGLVYLNLSNNLLEAIPDSIAGLDHLVELNVSGNQLVALPDSIGLLVNLKILNVSANQLNALPDSISNCRSLVELNASYNGLTYLPTKLGYELVNLEKLCVQLNKIRTLPTSVCEMRSLRLLDVHFNELRGLPYAIGKLTNLETLNLSSNFSDLTELPDSIGELTNLRELDLSNNQIHVLPITFGRLDQLMKLNLDQNPLVEPPMEIVNNGVEAVKEYMAKIWLDILLEEERKSQLTEESTTPQAGWLTRSTSWLGSVVSGVSESVAGYMAVGGKTDPYLDQQL